MVNVRVAGSCAAGRVELVAGGFGGVDCAAGVADCSTGGGTGASFEVERGGDGAGNEEGRNGKELGGVSLSSAGGGLLGCSPLRIACC